MINRVVLVGRLTKEPEHQQKPKVCVIPGFKRGCEEIKDILDSVQEIRKCD